MKKFLPLSVALVALLLLATCEREWSNPFDPNNTLDPEAWAPETLQIEDVSFTKKLITWTYQERNIEGFKLERKRGDEPWQVNFQTFPKTDRAYLDTISLNPAIYYHYRLYAYAGQNTSATKDTSFLATIPPPINLSINVNSASSITLSWIYSLNEHQGFKIDKKINEGEWQDEFAILNVTQNSFIDNTVILEENIYRYRVYSFILNDNSVKVEKYVSKPIVTTTIVTNVTYNSATCGGDVTNDGGLQVTARGICWDTNPNPTITNQAANNGSGTGSFVSSLLNLNLSAIYYVRAYATNDAGTTYGNQISFTTLSFPCGNNFTDPRDNKVYGTVQIGTQCWMKKNMNIGTMINSSSNQSNNSIIEKYCYGDSETNCNTYGGLYQWDEMMQYKTAQGVQGICPPGWHIPTDAEWTTLTTYLGGEYLAGGKMKETGTTHWSSPNSGATNSSGFTALPGGRSTPTFFNLGLYGDWWLSSLDENGHAWSRRLFCNSAEVSPSTYYSMYYGFSVRCIKDN